MFSAAASLWNVIDRATRKAEPVSTPRSAIRSAPALKAPRPTLEAAPSQKTMLRLAAMGPRASTRSRSLLNLIHNARDFNPDVAKAIDNFVTLANPGYTLTVYFVNRKRRNGEPVPDPVGQQLIDQFAARMFSEYSGAFDEAGSSGDFPGLDAFIAMTHLTAATQGAMAAEVELSESLDDIVDVYPVDPALIDFQMDKETSRLVPGLWLQGPFQPLDPIRFRYVPKDPDVNQPGGRSPLLAVLDTVFFQQQFLRELQAIAHMTNMPRLDVRVIEELAVGALNSTRPDLMMPGQEDNRKAYLDGFLSDLQKTINTLEADDAFIHWDKVDVKYIAPGGTAIPVGDLMAAIDKMMISGVKQLPLLLGRNEGATTTHATVQWQVFVQQLKGYQRISRALVTWVCNLYLRVHGRQSYVDFDYNEHRTSDEAIDAQTFSTRVNAWATIVDRGWATDDEAAMDLLGHEATGEPEPAPDVIDTVPMPDMSGDGEGDAPTRSQPAVAEDDGQYVAHLRSLRDRGRPDHAGSRPGLRHLRPTLAISSRATPQRAER